MRRSALAVPAAAVLSAVAVVAVPSPASAWSGANWWYQAYGVADITAQGWDGSGVRIAIVDEVVDPDVPEFDDASLTVDPTPVCAGDVTTSSTDESDLDGTDALAILVGNGTGASAQVGIAPKADVTYIALGDGYAESDCTDPWAKALDRARAAGARIVLTTVTFATASVDDVRATVDALNAGLVIVAPNANNPLPSGGNTIPAVLNGVVSVGGVDGDFALLTRNDGTPNIWPDTTVVGAGAGMTSVSTDPAFPLWRGDSFAAGIVAGVLAVAWQRYPDASGAQLIQSLIHNTTDAAGQAVDDTVNGMGYGIGSLRGMMAADPTQYPDVNPLLDKSSGQPPPDSFVPGGTSSPTEETASATPVADAGVSAGNGMMAWVVGGAIGVVGVAAIAVAVVVIVRRSRRSTGRSG